MMRRDEGREKDKKRSESWMIKTTLSRVISFTDRLVSLERPGRHINEVRRFWRTFAVMRRDSAGKLLLSCKNSYG